MTAARRWAGVAVIVAIQIGLSGAAYAGLIHAQQAYNQQRCGAINEIVAIPIPVPTIGNPSRAWVAEYSQITRMRGAQTGCHMPPPRYAHEPGG